MEKIFKNISISKQDSSSYIENKLSNFSRNDKYNISFSNWAAGLIAIYTDNSTRCNYDYLSKGKNNYLLPHDFSELRCINGELALYIGSVLISILTKDNYVYYEVFDYKKGNVNTKIYDISQVEKYVDIKEQERQDYAKVRNSVFMTPYEPITISKVCYSNLLPNFESEMNLFNIDPLATIRVGKNSNDYERLSIELETADGNNDISYSVKNNGVYNAYLEALKKSNILLPHHKQKVKKQSCSY